MAIAGANEAALALRRDGTVLSWAANNFGRTNVPANITNNIAIVAGNNTSFAVRSDGTVVAWGNITETNVPPGTANVLLLAEGNLRMFQTAPPSRQLGALMESEPTIACCKKRVAYFKAFTPWRFTRVR